jgi:predicted nicotinamide N-methyase
MAAAEADPLTGLGLPSVAAARAGATVLATDAAGDALVERGPWDLVIAADVLYLAVNVELLLCLLPRLAPAAWIADPGRRGARDFLAAARKRFALRSGAVAGGVSLHRLAAR